MIKLASIEDYREITDLLPHINMLRSAVNWRNSSYSPLIPWIEL